MSIAEVSELPVLQPQTPPGRTLAPATRKVAEGAANASRVFTGDDMNLHILSLARIICHADNPVAELSELIWPADAGLGSQPARRTYQGDGDGDGGAQLPRGVGAYVGESPRHQELGLLVKC